MALTERHACRWWEFHDWSKWTDKAWSKLIRDPIFTTITTTAPSEVGIECTQERRCQRCGMLQLRSEQTRL